MSYVLVYQRVAFGLKRQKQSQRKFWLGIKYQWLSKRQCSCFCKLTNLEFGMCGCWRNVSLGRVGRLVIVALSRKTSAPKESLQCLSFFCELLNCLIFPIQLTYFCAHVNPTSSPEGRQLNSDHRKKKVSFSMATYRVLWDNIKPTFVCHVCRTM